MKRFVIRFLGVFMLIMIFEVLFFPAGLNKVGVLSALFLSFIFALREYFIIKKFFGRE